MAWKRAQNAKDEKMPSKENKQRNEVQEKKELKRI